jgi:hypothetical protein
MGKVDPNQVLIKIRALTAELRAQLKKNETDAESARKLLPGAINARDRIKVISYINKIVSCSRRARVLSELLEDLARLKDGAAAICANAAADRGREKTVPPDYAPIFRRLCCTTDGFRFPGLVDFRAKVIIALYGRGPTDALSQRAGLEPAEAQALFDDAPTEAEVRQAYVDFAVGHQDLAPILEQIAGFNLREAAGIPTGPPTFGPPLPRLNQSVAGPARQSYRSDVYVPLDLPPFERGSWPALLEEVSRAVH